MNTISNIDNVIDSRDVIERLEELRAEQNDFIETYMNERGLESYLGCPWNDHGPADEVEELAQLEAFAKEARNTPDWEYGAALIHESYFTSYTQELGEECYEMPDTWPHRHIDWEAAAEELKQDYSFAEWAGETFYYRK